MNRRLTASIFVALLASLVPLSAYAANIPLLSPGWAIVPAACQACPCGFGGVLQIIQNLMNAAISLSVVIMLIAVVYAGWLFLSSPTNPENRNKGKTALTNAVVGMIIVLAAWVIVDFIMKILYGGQFGPWNNILLDGTGASPCVQAVQTSKLFDGNIIGATPGSPSTYGNGSGSGTGTGNGSCQVQTSGACASANMSAFGAAADQASEICYAESNGNANIASGVDKLGDGTPYSWGLFQINITANSVAGLNCPSAFSKQSCTVSSCGPGTGVHVVNSSLFNQCVAAAKVVSNNAAAALSIYQKAGNSWRPWGTHTKCGLALSHPFNLALLSECITLN